MFSDREEYYKWLLDRTMTVPYAPCIVCPNVLLEDKKMRFKKEFMGTFKSDKLFRVHDSKNEIPFNRVLADEDTIDDTVDWLNENIKEDGMSFDEVVEKAIPELWNPDEIAYSNIDGEYVIHERKHTDIVCNSIREKIPCAEVTYKELDWSRNVFVIKEKKNGC